jgi:hypothetical protein
MWQAIENVWRLTGAQVAIGPNSAREGEVIDRAAASL